jgi:hypothetical protein
MGIKARPPTEAASTIKEDFQGGLGDPVVQRVLEGPLVLLGLPDLLDQLDRRRHDHLYRPLLPRDPEALEVRQAHETNRNRPIRASPPKPRPTTFFA